jgi:dienelactone hydrolase
VTHAVVNHLNKSLRRSVGGLSVAWLVFASTFTFAQPASLSVDNPAKDLRESLVFIPVTVTDRFGRTETMQIPLTIYRPAGDTPKPLVVFNHGRAAADKRAELKRSRPENFARYMTDKGFVVIAPTRVGYADTYGSFDPEYAGTCQDMRIGKVMEAATTQVLATVEFAKTLPYVDASKWLVAGQSVGGLTTNATVGKRPVGLLGGINFSGGMGGNPDTALGQRCGVNVQVNYYRAASNASNAPMLWLYWENDLYWGAQNPVDWHKSWVSSGAKAEFYQFPAKGKNGHSGLDIDMDSWLPLVDRFLVSLGFDQPAIVKRPKPTNFASITDLNPLIANRESWRQGYQKFLELPKPRAFAIRAGGGWGSATGDYAIGRALGNCLHFGVGCKLYAVDDDVVWQQP